MLVTRIYRSIKHRMNKKSKWTTYKNRYNENISLFLPANFIPMFDEMRSGEFDNFIYNELDKIPKKESLVIWDVGAHVGFHTLNFASYVGETGKVISFEPNPINRERLKMHLESNANIKARIILIEKALSDSCGKVTFSLSDNVETGESSGGYIDTVKPPLTSFSYRKFVDVEVETATGDSLVDNHNNILPDIMKVDVEGAELLVLKGCEVLIKKKRPILFVEIHNILMMHYVSRYLSELNYGIEIIDEENAGTSRCFILAKYAKKV